MDDDVRVREAARDAVGDVDPDGLRDVLHDRLADGQTTPGVLTLVAARAAGGVATALTDRAAGVQLIYEGLRLTRRLATEETWAGADEAVVAGDVEVLAADVFVARGFYLLARTEAADCAVEVVRRFGHDQTLREDVEGSEAAALDRELEADVFELAVVAGTTAVGAEPSPELKSYAAELAAGEGVVGALPDSAPDRIAALADGTVSVDS